MNEVYTRNERNIDKTLTDLEKIQAERREAGVPIMTPIKTQEETIQNQKVIERELQNELTGLEETNEIALKRIKRDAGAYISEAIGYLSNCNSKDEARAVLEKFLDCTFSSFD